jgi:hypothetical protein
LIRVAAAAFDKPQPLTQLRMNLLYFALNLSAPVEAYPKKGLTPAGIIDVL